MKLRAIRFDESKKEIIDRISQIEQRLDGSQCSQYFDVFLFLIIIILTLNESIHLSCD